MPKQARKQGGRRGPRKTWTVAEEIFDVPNPDFPTQEAALQAGFVALLAIARPIIEEMLAANAAAPEQAE